MPKWKKDETDFVVSVNRDTNGTYICRLPKPVMEGMGIDDRIRFHVFSNRVEVSKP